MILIRTKSTSIRQNCKGGFHEFEIIRQGNGYNRERCVRCGKEITTKWNMNRRENQEYMEIHIGDYLQPCNPNFKKQYPNAETR